MMDRIREVRRGSMAAVNGSLSRRRQRSSSLRDSPEEDGAMEMQETSRLRDRGGKKDRDRDRSGRNKRRRGDRMLHGGHREEGEDSSEDSADEDDDDEEDDSSVAVRLPPPPVPNPTPSVSGMQAHNIRKGYPIKQVRPPGTGTWKVVEEMIGAPIPRKARSSSVKRSQECWVSGGGGSCSGGGDQISRQASMSPARPSPSSTTAPVSPTSSNVSVRKKMKPISVPKHRPPKTSKSSSIQEIEIEVAEVLFGMTRQVPPKQEEHKHDLKESNGSGNEFKSSRVSSPNPISPPANSQPSSTIRLSNPSSNSFPLTATAPKRKRPRMRFDEESTASPPSSTVLPSTSSSSAAKMDTEVIPSTAGAKTDPISPRSEKNDSTPVENGGGFIDPPISNATSAVVYTANAQHDCAKSENILDMKDSEIRDKEEAFPPPKESPAVNLDAAIEESSPASKAAMLSDIQQREEKFSIDLMAPPGKSSMEIESNSNYALEPVETENTPKPEASKAEAEKIDKKPKTEPGENVLEDKNGRKPSTDGSDSRKLAGKERDLDLQLDLEKLDKDVNGASKSQVLKQQQSKVPRADPSNKTEKAGSTASLPVPMQITGWPGGFPPFGFMGQVPPLPPVVPVDGSSNSSKQSFVPSQLRPKRCAAHCYIAQNIHYHQQITRLNPFWSSGAGPTPIYASKQYNLNTVPPSDSTILGSSPAARSLGSAQEKVGLPVSVPQSCVPAKDKSNASAQFAADVSQRKPSTLQQSSQPGSGSNMLAPAFIFPINQQQAAAAGTAVAAANRPGIAKLPPGSGCTTQSSSGTGYAAVGSAGANGSGTNMSFNYPGLPSHEAQYLAFLQNNAYSFPIPAHVGGAPPYRGASPAQAMPFFNLSFYPSQMLHPSQLRLQQQQPQSSQQLQQQNPPQLPYSQQGHQNPSTSSGSSSSQKNTQQSQRVPPAVAATAIPVGTSHGCLSSSKQQHMPPSARPLDSEPVGEDAPSTADSRVSQAQKSIYAQKFAVPAHSQNFALIAPAAVSSHSEKQQQSQNQVMKMDLTPSQAFAMSFASLGSAAASAAATAGAAPHGLDFSSISQNHALFQSLPEAARHSYQVSAAAAAAAAVHSAQQLQQNKKLEDAKSVAETGVICEETKISAAAKALANAQQHSLTFSRGDADSPISSILTNSVMDGSSRTLNLIQPPIAGAPRVSSRPASAVPPSNSVTNSTHLLPQPHQHQVLQLQKLQQQQLQLQQQLQQHQRAKSASSHSNVNIYTDRLPVSSASSKFPQGLAGFPPALIPSSASSQTAVQWKAATRAINPPASAVSLPPSAPSTPSSTKNHQIPLQQQVRSQQPSSAHPPHQISFGKTGASAGGGNSSSLSPAANIAVGSPQNSVSKSSGSPHSSSSATKPAPPPPSPTLPTLPFQKQQPSVAKNSPSSAISQLPSAANRSMPSILGNPQSMCTKPQQPSSQMPRQHSPQQAQLFFSYPYMQAQTSQPDAVSAGGGYFQQHQRRPLEQQAAQPRPPSSTGMLSLGPSPSSLSLTSVGGSSISPDPSKGSVPTPSSGNSAKSLLSHQPQFPATSQPISAAHPLMYIHAMQSVPLKSDVSAAAATASDQKPAASGR